MSDLPARVESILLEHGLLAPGDCVVVAVSGGLDSMVLLHALHFLAPRHGWSLTVAHFNHGLRGRSSDADEAFVRKTARALELPFKAGRGAVRSYAQGHKLSIEMAARQLRHEFLARTALAVESNKVLLAHHADDQLELFFLRLLRGAGPEGLSGMRLSAPSPANPAMALIRPLLPLTRRDLELYAAAHRLAFREDATNAHLDHERNRIRHELLPLLRSKFQPALGKTIGRFLEILSAESDFMAELSTEIQRQGATPFADLPPALQRRWLRTQCHQLGFTPEFDLIETLRRAPGAEWMIDPQRVLARDASGQVHCRTIVPVRFESADLRIRLKKGAGSVEFGSVQIQWKLCARPASSCRPGPLTRRLGSEPGLELFDADKVGDTIRLRHWQPGDRFQPIGLGSAVKLQDCFVNQKIPRAHRPQLIVAETAAGEIFWVEGLRMAERFKLEPSTTQCFQWSWERVGAPRSSDSTGNNRG